MIMTTRFLSDLWTRHPNHQPINPPATPDILGIVITKVLSFPVYLTSCSAPSLDHLPVLTETAFRSSNTHRIALISGSLTGPNSKLTWKIKFLSILNCTTGWQSTIEFLRRRSKSSGGIYS